MNKQEKYQKNITTHDNMDILLDIINNIPDIILLFDINGKIFKANREAYKQLGYTKEEIKNIILDLKLDTSKEEPITIEKPLETKKGITWYEIKATKIGKQLIVVARNIDKQREIERKLKLEKENYRKLIESANEAIIIAQNNKLVFANKKTTYETGYTKEELLSKPFLEIIHPEDREKVHRLYTKRIKGEKIPHQYSFRIIDKFGNIHWVEINSIKFQWKGKAATLSFLNDITERKKAEEILEQSYKELEEKIEERTIELAVTNEKLRREIKNRKQTEIELRNTKDFLQNIIDSSNEFIITIDLDYKITTWNKTAEYITGYNSSEILGKKIMDIEVFEKPSVLIKHIKTNSSISSQEAIVKTKRGKRRLIQFEISPIKNCLGILCIGKDITTDTGLYGKLLPGNNYLILDETSDKAIALFNKICLNSNRHGLLITRGNPDTIVSMTQPLDIDISLISSIPYGKLPNLATLDSIKNRIINFITKHNKTVILLDRIDYLINSFSFQELGRMLYHITALISQIDSILIVRVNPLILQPNELIFLKEEFQLLPYQRVDNIYLDRKSFSILSFIEEQNSRNMIISYQDISKKFNISRVTTGKRIKFLLEKGLVEIKILGRRKTLYLTKKAEKLIQHRQI